MASATDSAVTNKTGIFQTIDDILDELRSLKNDNNTSFIDLFMRSPSRRNLPEYYEKIKDPIDFSRIIQKHKTGEYNDLGDFINDVKRICTNTCLYYKKDSDNYSNAQELWNKFNKLCGKFNKTESTPSEASSRTTRSKTYGGALSSTSTGSRGSRVGVDSHKELSPAEVREACSIFFAKIYSAEDGDREVCTMFHLLPSKDKYPQYYQIIHEPIDMKMIAEKISDESYKSMDDLEKDLDLMIRNAKLFNEPGSQIYKDALTIKRLMKQARNEFDTGKLIFDSDDGLEPADLVAECANFEYIEDEQFDLVDEDVGDRDGEVPAVDTFLSSPGLTSNRQSLQQQQTSQAADDSFSDWDAESDDVASTNVYLRLFYTVRGYKEPGTGRILSEPFMRLPARSKYPDYYEEIKNPTTLPRIKKKIQTNKYEDLDDLLADIRLLFTNAMHYNADESQIFKDAQFLLSLATAKCEELKNIEMLSSSLDSSQDSSLKLITTPLKSPKSTSDAISVNMMSSDIQQTPSKYLAEMDQAMHANIGRKAGQGWTKIEHMRRRCLNLFKSVNNFKIQDAHGNTRFLITGFQGLPSPEEYPDYYEIVKNPIDIHKIRTQVNSKYYRCEEHVYDDLVLMLENAKLYFPMNHQIHKDAITLRHVLEKKMAKTRLKVKEALEQEGPTPSVSRNKDIKSTEETINKCKELHATVLNYKDAQGRWLSLPFQRLPLKQEMPNYYEIIKKPIDMNRIKYKIKRGVYQCLNDILADYALMFDNACRFNEPDSLIYKDALTLQRVCIEAKRKLSEDGNKIPDVKSAVQELMLSLFIETYNHQDDEGRTFSDSFAELTDFTSRPDRPAPPLTFDKIKRNLDRKRYLRLDRFQQDMFTVFTFAREVSAVDSQLFEDSVELQSFFIQKRDEMCHHGLTLYSPHAFKFTQRSLDSQVMEIKNKKLGIIPTSSSDDVEMTDVEGDKTTDILDSNSKPLKDEKLLDSSASSEKDIDDTQTSCVERKYLEKSPDSVKQSVKYRDETYHLGDFVYIEPREKACDPHILCIKELIPAKDGEPIEQSPPEFRGAVFFRPNETYHVVTRKFIDREVFLTELTETHSFTKIMGKCYVMLAREYFRYKPIGFEEHNVFVCESRYSVKTKSFKKLKDWRLPEGVEVELIERETRLQPVRVSLGLIDNGSSNSNASGGTGNASGDNGLLDELNDTDTSILDIVRNNVIAEIVHQPPDVNAPEGSVGPTITYYEQYNISAGCFKLGDCVYVRSDEENPYIARIDKIWSDQNGDIYFHGPWFVRPKEIEHLPTRMFFAKELFLSSISDSNPLLSVISRCSVLSPKDYSENRVTEIPLDDVYICESKYFEAEKSIRKLAKGLRKQINSDEVTKDEIYIFEHPIEIEKEASPLLPVNPAIFTASTSDLTGGGVTSSIINGSQQVIPQLTSQGFSMQPLVQQSTSQQQLFSMQPPCSQNVIGGVGGGVLMPITSVSAGQLPQNSKIVLPGLWPGPSTVQGSASSSVSFDAMSTSTNPSEDRSAKKRGRPSLAVGPDGMSVPKKDRRKSHLSGYILFAGDVRKSVVDSMPNSTFGDVSRKVGDMWRKLSKDQREDYEERARQAMEESKRKEDEADKALNKSIADKEQNFNPSQYSALAAVSQSGPSSILQQSNNMVIQGQQHPSQQNILIQGNNSINNNNTCIGMNQQQQTSFLQQPQQSQTMLVQQQPSSQQMMNVQQQSSQMLGGANIVQQSTSVASPAQAVMVQTATGPKMMVLAAPNAQSAIQIGSQGAAMIVRPSSQPQVNQFSSSIPQPNNGGTSSANIIPPTQPGPGQTPDPSGGAVIYLQQQQQQRPSSAAQIQQSSMGGESSSSQQSIPLHIQQQPTKGGTAVPAAFIMYKQQQQPLQQQTVMMSNTNGQPVSKVESVAIANNTSIATIQQPQAVFGTSTANEPSQSIEQPQPKPVFHAPIPHKHNKLQHSETYLRYVERMKSDSRYLSDWPKQLNATMENTKPLTRDDARQNTIMAGKLATRWLGNNTGTHENATTALWSMYDLMMNDALNIQRTVDFENL